MNKISIFSCFLLRFNFQFSLLYRTCNFLSLTRTWRIFSEHFRLAIVGIFIRRLISSHLWCWCSFTGTLWYRFFLAGCWFALDWSATINWLLGNDINFFLVVFSLHYSRSRLKRHRRLLLLVRRLWSIVFNFSHFCASIGFLLLPLFIILLSV